MSTFATTVVPQAARTRIPLVASGLLGATLVYLLLLAARPGGDRLVVTISDLATVVVATVATVSCAYAGHRHSAWMRAFWWLLAAACGAWATGEAIWTWYEVVLGVEVPYPSWADAGYLAGTPLAVAAFACHPSARGDHRRRIVPLLDAVAVACALLFVSWTLVMGPLWDGNGGMSTGDLVSIAYPFGDVVILVLLVLVCRNLPAGNRPATVTLLGGLFVMAVTDSTYTYLAQVGTYASGDLIDAGWFAAYLAIAAAGMLYESPVDRPVPVRGGESLTAILFPYVPIVVALAVIAVQVPRGRNLTAVEWAIAVCLTVLVLTRQVLFLVQRRSAHDVVPTSVPGRREAVAPPAGMPTARSEMTELTLQILAAGRTSSAERVQRVSSSMVMVLTSTAGALAVWDLGILVRGG